MMGAAGFVQVEMPWRIKAMGLRCNVGGSPKSYVLKEGPCGSIIESVRVQGTALAAVQWA